MMRSAPALLVVTLMSGSAFAASEHGDHGAAIFWGAGAEVDGSDADWLTSDDGTLVTWDAYAWVGGDDVKLRIEAEGESLDGDVEQSELRALVSWNVSEFWDVQAGLRHDFAPGDLTWAAVGVHGLAPYFFETDAHVFVSEDGDVALRAEQAIDIAVTQDLFVEPHVELNAFAQDVPELGIGAGVSSVEVGLQVRYEFSRKFAPYIDLVYERDLGETAIITRAAGEDVEATTLRLGLRVRL
ncbi:MAG: copper resistance protein B [Alphaproteobacteria bacterium]|nr:copper resistance protein B [Alphaproteobacteria bacterium]